MSESKDIIFGTKSGRLICGILSLIITIYSVWHIIFCSRRDNILGILSGAFLAVAGVSMFITCVKKVKEARQLGDETGK